MKGKARRFLSGHNARGTFGASHNGFRHGYAGGKKRPEYHAYLNAKGRCENPRRPDWGRYGGRGICFLFRSFEEFLAELGPRPAGLTLDRINNDGPYAPDNVRWTTLSEQQRNKRERPRRFARCHSDREHVALGLCQRCYGRVAEKRRPARRRQRVL